MVVPPDLERLRELRNDEIREVLIGYALDLLDDFDELVNSHFWLLSLADSGGRLVVEQPCEHGALEPHGWVCGEHDWDEKCARQNCEAYLDFGDHCAWLHRKGDMCWSASACGGGSRKVVWPTDKEEE